MPQMNFYHGVRDPKGNRVTVNDMPLAPRNDLRNHSPSGLEWGYGGSGPAQLALAILANEVGPAEALNWYQEFKWRVVSRLEHDEWALTSVTIKVVLDEIKKDTQTALDKVSLEVIEG